MGRIEKTVFISYRRTNYWTALAIFQNLQANGYDVFFDYKSIPSGDFEQVITENVKSRAHFIVILSPSALKRCKEPGDWLRREIEAAINNKRNIIPLMMEGFDFGSPATIKALTGKLADLRKYNALGIPAEYFEEAMGKLRSDRFLSRPLESVSHPVSNITKQITENQKTAASEAAPVEKEELTALEWTERGYIFHESKNFDEAIRCYSEAIRLKPDFAEAYYNRGNAWNDKSNFDVAIQDYDTAIKLKPDYAEAFNNRGETRRRQGEVDIAIADFTISIELKNPDLHLPYNNRGIAYRERGDLDSAIANYNEAIRLQPDFATAYANRAQVGIDKGELDNALADLDEAISNKPNVASAYYQRGITFSRKGNNLGALHDFQKTTELTPESGIYRAWLASALKKLGSIEEAKLQQQIASELIEKANEYDKACFEAICGNTEKALENLRIALDKKQESKEWAHRDPDFENIRNDPRFKELVGE